MGAQRREGLGWKFLFLTLPQRLCTMLSSGRKKLCTKKYNGICTTYLTFLRLSFVVYKVEIIMVGRPNEVMSVEQWAECLAHRKCLISALVQIAFKHVSHPLLPTVARFMCIKNQNDSFPLLSFPVSTQTWKNSSPVHKFKKVWLKTLCASLWNLICRDTAFR